MAKASSPDLPSDEIVATTIALFLKAEFYMARKAEKMNAGSFLHGADYRMSGEVKSGCCKSCAFVTSPDSVRTSDVSLEELMETVQNCDDFACHTITRKDGRADRCAAWHAHYGAPHPLRRDR